MPLVRQLRIFRADLRSNPDVLYIFGDNEARVGLGGQAAEMRGEPNAVGVATLKAPGRYWREEDADRQNAVIDADLVHAFEAMKIGRVIVFPLDGIGTGLADLEPRAPSTFAHLTRCMEELARMGMP